MSKGNHLGSPARRSMRVASSPRFLESVANHPKVFPYVTLRGVSEIRFGPNWANCIGLEWEDGGFVMHRQDDYVYEVHTLFLPRARDTAEKAQEAKRYMFDKVGARLLLTQVARDLPHVRRFAERAGFVWFGEAKAAMDRGNGPVDVDYFRMEGQGCPQQLSQGS